MVWNVDDLKKPQAAPDEYAPAEQSAQLSKGKTMTAENYEQIQIFSFILDFPRLHENVADKSQVVI